MIEQKKKLRLDKLKVDSFVTDNTVTINGKGASDFLTCKVDCYFGGTETCYSGPPCGVLPTGVGVNTCDAAGGEPFCQASNFTCNNMGTCHGNLCYGSVPA